MDMEDLKAFLSALEAEEEHFRGLYEKAEQTGRRLRYVASYQDGKASAGLQEIAEDHPFYHLEGKDNIVLFYTDRYRDQPLVVKGAGAGADVTASGIFADMMKIAHARS
jgi:aspartokinase/homoserine dehydrogenase 1